MRSRNTFQSKAVANKRDFRSAVQEAQIAASNSYRSHSNRRKRTYCPIRSGTERVVVSRQPLGRQSSGPIRHDGVRAVPRVNLCLDNCMCSNSIEFDYRVSGIFTIFVIY